MRELDAVAVRKADVDEHNVRKGPLIALVAAVASAASATTSMPSASGEDRRPVLSSSSIVSAITTQGVVRPSFVLLLFESPAANRSMTTVA